MKKKYNADQIDERILKYVNAYIKQVVNNSQKNYFRTTLRHTRYAITFEEYNDNINYSENECVNFEIPIRYFDFNEIRIGVESKELYNALTILTPKQQEVLLKNVVLDIPMKDVAAQMGITLSKAYKHKRNAVKILQRSLNDEYQDS